MRTNLGPSPTSLSSSSPKDQSMVTALVSIWQYRAFILGSTKREFQAKYKNSLLGFAWPILNPLALILVYTLVFSKLMSAKVPGAEGIYSYSVYLCIGIIIWTLFSEITARSQNIFLDNANLIKKLNFPRICLPIIIILNASLNFLIIFSLFTIFLILTGNFPGWCFLAVIPLLLIQILFAIGVGMTLGTLNVFFRDVGYFYTVALQFWFWLTPIVYSVNILPERVQDLLQLNPLTNLIIAYQTIFVLQEWPNWASLIYISSASLVLILLARYLFIKHAGEMVDLL